MSKSFHNDDQYSATPGQLWNMLSTQGYWEEKYSTLGSSNLEWKEFSPGDTTLTVSSTREVDANLPAVAKKVIGETAVVTQTENWSRAGDKLTCAIEITTKGAPGGTTGTMDIEPHSDGARWKAAFEIKVPIPLVGKKLEGIMHDETEANFVKEKEFNDNWLSKNG